MPNATQLQQAQSQFEIPQNFQVPLVRPPFFQSSSGVLPQFDALPPALPHKPLPPINTNFLNNQLFNPQSGFMNSSQKNPEPETTLIIKNLDTGEVFINSDRTEFDSKITELSFQSRSVNPNRNQSNTRSNSSTSNKPVSSPSSAPPKLLSDKINFAPFLVSEERVTGILKAWLSSLWFTPDKVGNSVTVSDVKRYYLPYWLIYALTSSPYSALVCTIQEEIFNNTKQVKEEWKTAKGVQKSCYPDILLNAAVDSEDKSLASSFEKSSWKLNRIIYGEPLPQELSTPTEQQKVPTINAAKKGGLFQMVTETIEKTIEKTLEETGIKDIPAPPLSNQLLPHVPQHGIWAQYESKVIAKQEKSLASNKLLLEYKAERLKDMNVNIEYAQLVKRLVYLPIYRCLYVYEGKSYKFVVNGHSEEVIGDRPYGMGKIGSWGESSLKKISKVVEKY